MRSISKIIFKKLARFYFSSVDSVFPNEVETYNIEFIPPSNNGTYSPTVIVKSGLNEPGVIGKWTKENEPLLKIESDGKGYEIERYDWQGKESKKFTLNFGDAQYLMIALRQLEHVENKIRNTKSYYRSFKGDLKDLNVNETTEPKEDQTAKLRPMGHLLLDLEELIIEMTAQHDLQWGDVLNLVRGYLEVHSPEAQEEYVEGGNPEFYYGPKKEQK